MSFILLLKFERFKVKKNFKSWMPHFGIAHFHLYIVLETQCEITLLLFSGWKDPTRRFHRKAPSRVEIFSTAMPSAIFKSR